jgi:hypothetical protein
MISRLTPAKMGKESKRAAFDENLNIYVKTIGS